MIAIKVIPYGHHSMGQMADYQWITFGLLAVLLVGVFVYLKCLKRPTIEPDPEPAEAHFDYLSTDVLMQHKQVEDPTSVPFVNYSIAGLKVVFYVAVFMAFVWLCFSI